MTEVIEFSGKKILVVEDYEINQEIIRGLLELMNCEVEVVSSGMEAVSSVEQSDYDLIFMDIQMPEMDGYETTKQIRKIEKNKHIIVALTANTLAGDDQKCLKAGMNDYVSKPIRKIDLEKVLVKHLTT